MQRYSNGVLNGDEEFETEVKNGKVCSYKGREFGYAVDFKWADGNMVEKTIFDEESVTKYKYAYGELKNQWNFDLIGFLDVLEKKTNKEYLNSAYVTTEYLSNNLPVSIDYSFEDEESESPVIEKCAIKYELDNKNRVQKIMVEVNKNNNVVSSSFELEYAE